MAVLLLALPTSARAGSLAVIGDPYWTPSEQTYSAQDSIAVGADNSGAAKSGTPAPTQPDITGLANLSHNSSDAVPLIPDLEQNRDGTAGTNSEPPPDEAAGAADDLAPAAPPRTLFRHNQPRGVKPFPIVLNRTIQKYVDAYLEHAAGLRQAFARSQPFLSDMAKTLESYGVPRDFVFLAFAESAFTSVGDGPWQLTKATARRFGLKVNYYIDERRDPLKSTRAAAEYLAELHDQVGDWRLTVVGWNTGEGSIDRLMSWAGSSYERLMARLPHRTRALLNRFLAVTFIARNSSQFGLDSVAAVAAQQPAYKRVLVDSGTPLSEVAEQTHTSVDVVQDLNPAFLRGIVPPTGGPYEVLIPRETGAFEEHHS